MSADERKKAFKQVGVSKKKKKKKMLVFESQLWKSRTRLIKHTFHFLPKTRMSISDQTEKKNK